MHETGKLIDEKSSDEKMSESSLTNVSLKGSPYQPSNASPVPLHFHMVKQLTIIGRGECGKTSLVRRFMKNEFSEELSATPIENEDYVFASEGKQFKLKIWDTSGQDDFLRLRGLTLPMSDYVMICYSISDPLSFYEVENTLMPMVKQKAREDVKIMLVATKIDKRSEDTVSTEEGVMLARRIGAFKFIECSSVVDIENNAGIKNIFSELRKDMLKSFSPKQQGLFRRVFFCCV